MLRISFDTGHRLQRPNILPRSRVTMKRSVDELIAKGSHRFTLDEGHTAKRPVLSAENFPMGKRRA